MNRREFCALPLILTGCGGSDMERVLQPSPRLVATKNMFEFGVRGNWTPSFTFGVPGDLSVSYTTQAGRFHRFGPFVYCNFTIYTSTFTHTTASGTALITGLPVTCVDDSLSPYLGTLRFRGITKAGFTQFIVAAEPNTNSLDIQASGSGLADSFVIAADMPTGGTVSLMGSIWYLAKNIT